METGDPWMVVVKERSSQAGKILTHILYSLFCIEEVEYDFLRIAELKNLSLTVH